MTTPERRDPINDSGGRERATVRNRGDLREACSREASREFAEVPAPAEVVGAEPAGALKAKPKARRSMVHRTKRVECYR
jgi:hypothetical protein